MDQLSRWGMALTDDGDILICGCDVAATDFGRGLVDTIAAAADRNVIAGNNGDGIAITDGSNNVIHGNIIGLLANGTTSWANDTNGISFDATSSFNTIGGFTADLGNVISGNGIGGVWIEGNSNKIRGNAIGLNAGGDTNIGTVLQTSPSAPPIRWDNSSSRLSASRSTPSTTHRRGDLFAG